MLLIFALLLGSPGAPASTPASTPTPVPAAPVASTTPAPRSITLIDGAPSDPGEAPFGKGEVLTYSADWKGIHVGELSSNVETNTTYDGKPAIHLSVANLAGVVRALVPCYGADCPAVVAHRVSWPDDTLHQIRNSSSIP